MFMETHRTRIETITADRTTGSSACQFAGGISQTVHLLKLQPYEAMQLQVHVGASPDIHRFPPKLQSLETMAIVYLDDSGDAYFMSRDNDRPQTQELKPPTIWGPEKRFNICATLVCEGSDISLRIVGLKELEMTWNITVNGTRYKGVYS